MGLLFRAAHDRNQHTWIVSLIIVLLATCQLGQGIQLTLDSADSIKAAAKQVAEDLMTMYNGNQLGGIPGNLPAPYYWWQCGAMFGSLIDYYFYTGDDQFNDVVTEGMLFQVGPNNDYMTPNQTKTEGNDDQGFWAVAAMSAAEQKFPDPPADKPQWLALVQAVFNTQALRWDTQFCNGGLRWQIFTFNTGYNYKNTISNGILFNLGARLAMYTRNQTYADWAERVWDWTEATGMMNQDHVFFDGAHTDKNCTDINKQRWSYNAGVYLLGAANMYNYTNGSDIWRDRVSLILNSSNNNFFSQSVPNVMVETQCEPFNACNTDNWSFKAYLSRWMAATTKMAPWTYDIVMERIRASAAGAALQCSGGSSGTLCGMKWTEGARYDGTTGVGQQMSALEVIQSLLVSRVAAPVTNSTGGTSRGDPSAGSSGTFDPSLPQGTIQQRDKVGAGFLTTLIIISGIGSVWWMIS
ncbi:MAG: hypothetical protein LQ343_003224 [Gyalolechia ehrenbergii]|nr:MAG: hypothetical protein LQ343_003224 [Gyalolechia ehrenbergii]